MTSDQVLSSVWNNLIPSSHLVNHLGIGDKKILVHKFFDLASFGGMTAHRDPCVLMFSVRRESLLLEMGPEYVFVEAISW
jgi:hypothetical protein